MDATDLQFLDEYLLLIFLIEIYLLLNLEYLIDFHHSLSFNRFHTKLELPANYSLSKMDTFIITHNFGFGNYEMTAKIIDYSPPKHITLSE